MRNFILTLFLVGARLVCFAQQLPQYSQYYYNLSTVNPGYVTNKQDIVSLGALYRQQWQGIEGSPRTLNGFASVPLNKKMEISINYVNDQIGSEVKVVNQLANVDYAYVVDLTKDIHLSMGVKVGLTNFNVTTKTADPLNDDFFNNQKRSTDFNLGAGLFLFTDNLYFGVSTPNFISNTLRSNDGITFSEIRSHLFGVAGYIFEISDDVKLKPSVLVRYTSDTPLSYDLSLNTLLLNRFELGVSYRNQDAVVGLAAFNITPSLKIGYAYDVTTSDLNLTSQGSHEFILLYDFDLLGLKKNYASPRFY